MMKMVNGRLKLKLSFLLVFSTICKAQQRAGEELLNDFNQAVVEKYQSEIKSMNGYVRLYNMNILGQLAFYSRIYRLWIEQPSTARSNFIYHLPQINFASDLHELCIRGFQLCIDNIWNDIKKRNVFLFTSDVYDEFIVRKSEVRRLVLPEMFDFDFSAIYLLCWMTMNNIGILKELPYCDIQPISASNWPSRELARNLTFGGVTHIPLGSFDTVPFRCAKSSFCVDGCNPSPCPGNSTCVLKSSYNEDLTGMYRNLWNVSCDCPEPGYVFRFDVDKCVDINECLYVDCEETHGNNWECANMKGSYSCVCKLGFQPVYNSCVPIELYPASFWKGPALAGTQRFTFKMIVLIVFLLLSAW